MAFWKVILGIDYTSGNPAGGTPRRRASFTEIYYREAFSQPQSEAAVLSTARAGLLPSTSRVVFNRFQQIDPIGPSQQRDIARPGTLTIAQDAPQVSIGFRMDAVGVPNARTVILRAIPDARAVYGEYDPGGPFSTNLNGFIAQLKNDGWKFRAKNLELPRVDIVSIDEDGIVTCAEAFDPTTTGKVTILRAVNAKGRQVGGDYKVISPITTTTFKLRNWTKGECTGGQARKLAFIFPSFNRVIKDPRVTNKKVGRPFAAYVGKASTRR